jgi:hypothetical protein
MCGRAGSAATGDMNIDWECKRSAKIYMLHTGAEDITRTIARLPRLRNEYRRRNLTRWITDAIARHERLVGLVLPELPECTHGPATRGECTPEESLPPCTC